MGSVVTVVSDTVSTGVSVAVVGCSVVAMVSFVFVVSFVVSFVPPMAPVASNMVFTGDSVVAAVDSVGNNSIVSVLVEVSGTVFLVAVRVVLSALSIGGEFSEFVSN